MRKESSITSAAKRWRRLSRTCETRACDDCRTQRLGRRAQHITSCVRPVELIQDPVRLFSADRHAAGTGAERTLAAFAVLPDESVREVDVCEMIFAGDRILERVSAPFADAFGAKHALSSTAFDRNRRLGETDDRKCWPEQLPRHAAQLSREDLREHLNLLVRRRRVNHECALSVALVNCLRPVDDCRALDARQVHLSARALRDLEAHKGATASILRARKTAEVAPATEVAIAVFVTCSANRPPHRRCCPCHRVTPFRDRVSRCFLYV